jgi:hypothetical protein
MRWLRSRVDPKFNKLVVSCKGREGKRVTGAHRNHVKMEAWNEGQPQPSNSKNCQQQPIANTESWSKFTLSFQTSVFQNCGRINYCDLDLPNVW